MLHGHCAEVGRDPKEIRVTVLNGGDRLFHGDVAGFVDQMRPFAALGVDTVILRPSTMPLAAWMRDVVAPAVAPLVEL